MRVVAPADASRVAELRQTLDAGESEALALAVEVHAAAILIDEEQGRRAARGLGLPVVGVIGILIRAKQRSLVAEVGPLLEKLQQGLGFFISDELMSQAKQLAGE
jgi:predicted nucleic acid-binding protein